MLARGWCRRLRTAVLCLTVIFLIRLAITWTTVSPTLNNDGREPAGPPPPICPGLSRPDDNSVLHSNGDWQVQRQATDEVFVVSAFYDDRPVVGALPVVRIMAVARPTRTLFYCHVWFGNQSHPYVTEVTVTKTGRGDRFKGVVYGQYMFSCPLNAVSPVPTHVSIATGQCGTSTILLHVVKPSGYKHEFGVCVAISYGDVDPVRFSEWMELQLMFGVTEVNVYNGTMTRGLHTLFSHYQQAGSLRLHQMPPPVDKFDKNGAKLSSPASLNDCMYRNMYRYKLMLVLDFDEVIVPRQHATYSEMLQRVNKLFNVSDLWWSYSFRNAYFFRELSDDTEELRSDNSGLMTMRYRHRVSASRFLYAAKSMIDPRRCLSVFNHYCYIKFDGTPTKRRFTLDVPTDLAMSHHYRDCNQGKEKCAEFFEGKTSDDTMLKYKDELESRVKRVLTQIGYKDGTLLT